MRYRKRSPIVDAIQWWHHGDSKRVTEIPRSNKTYKNQRDTLGWLDTKEGGHVIFPGDYIIVEKATGIVSSCNAITFERLYESFDDRVLPIPGQFRGAA